MSQTYSTCEITEETTDRCLILFCLVLARRMVNRRSKWRDDLKSPVVDRLNELIEEYQNPYAESDDYRSFASAPVR